MTPASKRIWEAMRAFRHTHGYNASLAELGRACGLSSFATVSKHLQRLVQEGRVRVTADGTRKYEAVEPPTESRCPTCGQPIRHEQQSL